MVGTLWFTVSQGICWLCLLLLLLQLLLAVASAPTIIGANAKVIVGPRATAEAAAEAAAAAPAAVKAGKSPGKQQTKMSRTHEPGSSLVAILA